MDFLTCKPKYLHYQALQMWANYLETNDPCMSAEDAVMCSRTESIQMLSDEQKRIVLRLRDEAALTLQTGLQAKQEDN